MLIIVVINKIHLSKGFDALKDELSFHWGDHNNSLGPGSLPHHYNGQLNGHVSIIIGNYFKEI